MVDIQKQKENIPINPELLEQIKEKQFNEVFDYLDTQPLSVIHQLIDWLSATNPEFKKGFMKFQDRNSEKFIIMMRKTSDNQVNINNSKKLNSIKSQVAQIKDNLNQIQKALNWSTSLSLKAIDSAVWLFTDNTVFNNYKNTFNNTKNQAEDILNKLIQDFKWKKLHIDQRNIYDSLIKELSQIQQLKLESTWIIRMTANEVLQTTDKLKFFHEWIKWETEWIVDWFIWIAVWSVELAKFMIKYSFSEKYRSKINTEAKKIFNYCSQNWLSWVSDKVYRALKTEMDKIAKLPPEKQAEAIWKIAWNVISVIWVIKWATVVTSELWNIWGKIQKAEKLITKASIANNTERVAKINEMLQSLLKSQRWLQAFDVLLTWVAETALLKWLWASFKWISAILKSGAWNIEKLKAIDKAIDEAKAMKAENGEEKAIQEKYLSELNAEKTKLIKEWGFETKLRIELWEKLLGKKFDETQRKVIIKAHNEPSLQEKVKILNDWWFEKPEREKLLRNYVCWGEISKALIKAKKLEIERLSEAVKKWYENITNIIEKSDFLFPKWKEYLKTYLENIKNNWLDETSVKKFEKAIEVLRKWYSETWQTTDLNRIKLWDDILEEINNLQKNNRNLKIENKNFDEYALFVERLEKDDITIKYFTEEIEEFSAIKSKDKPKDPERLKKVVKEKIEKYKIWESYRMKKPDADLNRIIKTKGDFIKLINMDLNFQFNNKIKFNSFESILLFLK